MTERIPLTKWLFVRGGNENDVAGGFNERRCQSVTLPHTVNGVDGADGDGYYYRGKCLYRRHFNIGEHIAGRHVFIEFGGANRVCGVYINGVLAGTHIGGYSRFRFDITDKLRAGDNIFSAIVSNEEDADIAPVRADSTSFSGLIRRAFLIVTDDVHFDMTDYGSCGVYPQTVAADKENARLSVISKIKNESSAPLGVVNRVSLIDADGNAVACESQRAVISGGEVHDFMVTLTVKNPSLWQGIIAPYLYTLRSEIIPDGCAVSDEYTLEYGIRTLRFDPKLGCILNGERYPLYGVSYSHDRDGHGRAATYEDLEEDIALLKEIGARGIRCPLYMPDQYFLTLCDRAGILCSLEVPLTNTVSYSDKFRETSENQLIELMRQCRTHACAATYGIANEIANGGLAGASAPDPAPVLTYLNDVIHRENPNFISHLCANRETNVSSNYITDVTGWNIYNGWYGGEHEGDIESAAARYDKILSSSVGRCNGLSEFGPGASPYIHSDSPKALDYSEEYQCLYHSFYRRMAEQHTQIAFCYAWLLCDFGCDSRTECQRHGINNKGFVSYDRKVKKDVFYYYKAAWTKIPFVHLCSARYNPRPCGDITLRAYSNCESVQLSVKGVTIGIVRKGADHTFEFRYTASAGEADIEVKGMCGGVICGDRCTVTFE